jgi:thioredoxin-related protein
MADQSRQDAAAEIQAARRLRGYRVREAGCKFKYLKLLAFALVILAGSGAGQAELPRVEEARDLLADARTAELRGLPLLLAFASSYCGYCEQVEEWFLVPLLLAGYEEDRILIRKVIVDSGSSLLDFEGDSIEGAQLATRYQVRMVPTLVFVDSRGRELAERLVGLTTVDFYGGYLESGIEAAEARLRETAD